MSNGPSWIWSAGSRAPSSAEGSVPRGVDSAMDALIIEAMRWWERRGKKRHTDSRAKNPSDGRLVAMAKRYPEAFQALYDRHFQATYQRVYDQVGNEVLAQELTAQVFSRAERLIKAHRQAGP